MDIEHEKQRLRALERMTDEILDELVVSDAKLDGAINWGDLGCVEAQLIITAEAAPHYTVVIEEADPYNEELHSYVFDRLLPEFGAVHIRTEW